MKITPKSFAQKFELKWSLGGPLSKLRVTPPFSINFRCQIENQVSDYRLLGASSYHYMSWTVPSWCNLKLQQCSINIIQTAQCLYTYWRCAPPIMGWFEDFFHIFSVCWTLSFLAHLTQRIMWAIAITWRPSSVCKLLKQSSPLKPLGQFKPNLAWIILRGSL
jgi:hypothetical protein